VPRASAAASSSAQRSSGGWRRSASKASFERELAEACIANNQSAILNLLKEFEHVDREAWAALP
jgi:hypothetical protein